MQNGSKKIAVFALVGFGVAVIGALVIIALTPSPDAATVGQIVTFAGIIITALVAYLKGDQATSEASNAKTIGLDNAARLDEVHAKVDSGTATIMSQLGHPVAQDAPIKPENGEPTS